MFPLSELLGFSIRTTGVSSLLGAISLKTKDDVDWSASAEGILESVSASDISVEIADSSSSVVPSVVSLSPASANICSRCLLQSLAEEVIPWV